MWKQGKDQTEKDWPKLLKPIRPKGSGGEWFLTVNDFVTEENLFSEIMHKGFEKKKI